MATYEKHLLSGSTDGRQIPILATGTPGTLIHTAVPGTSSLDEIFLYATNPSADNAILTIEWGGTTDPDDILTFTVPSKDGDYLIIPGKVLRNSLVVRAYSNTYNAVNISGYVHRIT